MVNFRPRITIAALKGGSGKTILSLGLTSSWLRKGHTVAPFKKGPDFIDSGWLAFAARRPCHNLDPFLMTREQILESFLIHSAGAEVSVIEGNRGLYDGLDLAGCCSTAELGKMLRSPVVLIVDVTMATRTAAALVLGCQKFDPELKIAGIILNRVAGARQESLVRSSIERYCGIPVVGSIPKLRGDFFPERHMGLIPCQERLFGEKAVDWATAVVEKNLDLAAIWKLAQEAEFLDGDGLAGQGQSPFDGSAVRPRIGIVRDRSFWFYYPENLGQLKDLGATLIELDSIGDKEIPDLDGLYIGGGFPEIQAEVLADNKTFKQALKQRIEDGLPVYAECGGFMYLGNHLVIDGKTYPMAGVLPVSFVLEKKPQGHGYTVLEVLRQNPYYEVGETIRGHEFHYSKAVMEDSEKTRAVFKVLRGWGLDGESDGLCRKNLLAMYTHLHAGGNRIWAKSFVRQALLYGKKKISKDLKKKD
jgi:cobyrinic acid a,c-diamide synthase